MGMTQQEIDHVLSQANNAIVGVNRSEGRAPQLTVIWYAWDGETFYFSTTKDRAKYLNIKRNASISLIVDDPESHKYITAYGQAKILEQQTGDKTRLILQKYVPADQLERRVQAIEADASRVIIALRPEKMLTN